MMYINMEHFWAVHACLLLRLVHIYCLAICGQVANWVGSGGYGGGEGGGENSMNVVPHLHQGLPHLRDH